MTLDSKIITKKSELDFLNEILDKPKKSQLLYRGSEHNFSALKFHELCDSYPHTLTIVKNEFKKIIGGYTPLIWN